jgi:hypothetical protein
MTYIDLFGQETTAQTVLKTIAKKEQTDLFGDLENIELSETGKNTIRENPGIKSCFYCDKYKTCRMAKNGATGCGVLF